MTPEQPTPPALGEAHRSAIDAVNRWRGHCVELFARVEQALALTLAAFAIRLPPAITSKIDHLEAIVGPKGAHRNARLAKALADMRLLARQRNLIVHARTRVWVNDRGEWLWEYRFTPSGKDKSEQVGHWLEADARKFENDLRRVSQSLCSQLVAMQTKHAL